MKVTWKGNGSGKEPVPADNYEVQITDYRFTESLKGNPQITWETKIVGPGGSEYIGRTLYEQTTLMPSSIWKLGWLVESLGINTGVLPEVDTESEEFRRIIKACVGRRLWFTVDIDVWDGKKRNKVVDYQASSDQAELNTLEDIEDVPDFIKSKGKPGEKTPF